ncbi:MAG TPA: hypothetical protein VHO03_00175 [Ignavibacteriales bacterium]|nr:hypothetical protein [Ignavibacteriales bacterium]
MTFPAIEFNALNFGLLKNIILAIVLGAIAAFMSFRQKFLTKGGFPRQETACSALDGHLGY